MKFLHDYNIPYSTSGTKHNRRGWVQIGCPFCAGGVGTHLGIKLPGAFASCWRCKGKSIPNTIQALLGISWPETRAILSKYETNKKIQQTQKKKIKLIDKKVKFPMGTTDLTPRHDAYLESRRFDPEYLEKVFDLQGTGPTGEYKHRIIAPIVLQDTLVSYQGRDITDKSKIKYKACANEDEALPHKHTLYGADLARLERVVIVEGITDVWRLGPGAVATLGTSFTPAQIKMLCKNWEKAFVLFDPEPTAQKIGNDLGEALGSTGMNVEILSLEGCDPGDMEECDASALMKDLKISN